MRSLAPWSVTTTQPQCCALPPEGPRIAASRMSHSTSSGIGSGERYLREGVECSASSAVSGCSPPGCCVECADIIGSRGPLVDGVRVEALKFVEEHPVQRPWRERALEEAADSGRAVPACRDANLRLAALRLDVERRDETRIGVGLDQRAARLGLGDPHQVVAGPPARGDLEAGDGARAHAAFFYLEVRERGGQETRVLVHVGEMFVYLLCGSVNRALGGSLHFCHGPCLPLARRLACHGLPPIWEMSTSLVTPCCCPHFSTSSSLTRSGSSAMASSAISVSPALRSKSTISCLRRCTKTTSWPQEERLRLTLEGYDSPSRRRRAGGGAFASRRGAGAVPGSMTCSVRGS